jgi:hypothetical protein
MARSSTISGVDNVNQAMVSAMVEAGAYPQFPDYLAEQVEDARRWMPPDASVWTSCGV